MRGMKIVAIIGLAVALAGWAVFAQQQYVEVKPGQGVSFSQVNFTWQGAETKNSSIGQVDVEVDTLRSSTGLRAGYINIATRLGWVVQNLPVFADFPYRSISTKFELSTSSGQNVTSLDAFVLFSSTPFTSPPSGPFTTFQVGDTEFNGQGIGEPVVAVPPQPPKVVSFRLGGLIKVCWQAGHPNVETAHNQCAPAAVANSLDWLRANKHLNRPGLDNDGSLVGELDGTMRRAFINRQNGNGVTGAQMLSGKLCYLANNQLALSVKHQAIGAFPIGVGGGNFIACNKMSLGPGPGPGAVPTAAFIIDEICAGEDVELVYLYSARGGHAVELVGAGTINGTPWIAYKSDHIQSNTDLPNDGIDNNEGTTFTDFSFLVDTDGDGLPNLVNEATVPNVAMVISESPEKTPTLTQWGLLLLGLLLAGSLAWMIRRRVITRPAGAA